MWHTLFKIRLLMGLVPALGAVLWMGMDSGSTYYDQSPAQVQSALKAAHLPTHILGSSISGSRVRVLDDGSVVTALIDMGGREAMHFVTTIEPDGEGAQVSTEVKAPDGELAEHAPISMKQNAFTVGLLGKLAQEHTASAIEGRPFDMMFASAPATKGMLAAMPGMDQQINQANEAANSFAKNEQEWAKTSQEREFSKSYDDGWAASSDGDDGGWGAN